MYRNAKIPKIIIAETITAIIIQKAGAPEFSGSSFDSVSVKSCVDSVLVSISVLAKIASWNYQL